MRGSLQRDAGTSQAISAVSTPIYNGDYFISVGRGSASAILVNRPGVTNSNLDGYAETAEYSKGGCTIYLGSKDGVQERPFLMLKGYDSHPAIKGDIAV